MSLKTKIIIILTCLLFSFVACFIIYSSVISKSDCTETTVATIIDIERISGGANRLPSYYPVFEYEVNGKTYTHKSNTSINPNTLGRKTEIKYNPNNPQEMTYSENKFSALLIGGGFLLISFLFIIGVLKNKTIK